MVIKVIAIVLIAAGLIGLSTGAISFTTKEKVVDLGPVDVTRDKEHYTRVPMIASILVIAAGAALLFAGSRQHKSL
jgi:hypothetical protein